jgi:DNA-directed RNA polymerase specialized sigma subunit
MKKLSQLKQGSRKNPLNIQDETINYISAEDLKKYLSIAEKFICDETKELINYLIVNNANYVKDLAPEGAENALAYFYDNGPYKEEHFSELYALIGKINKQHRLLEIPVFQTKDEFYGIISRKLSPDQVIIDLETEEGRNAVVKKYTPLCYKEALAWNGKSNLQFDDLMQNAFIGLTWAMNAYCKKSHKAIRKEVASGEELNIENYKTTTFLTVASYYIRFAILEAVKNESQLVRLPANKQAEEREELGYNVKNTAISGDKIVGGEEKGKSVFDYISRYEDAGKHMDEQDINKAWKILMKKLREKNKFSDKVIKAWIQFNQLGGVPKRKNKEIADELGISSSNVTYYCSCINNFIKKDPELSKIAKHLIMLYNESLQRYYDEDGEEPASININEKITDNQE